ncbi:glycolate oxidase FAD binding subunit [Haloactinospora alba]|uniref:Glycolate oxidase FAD binding subunit n=1 Tax=Haloactinospora alba TaxID=405555 RepID=A0A543NGX7_9ACTN|nr:FAD-binding oxidoreductase [Haloactinospora alba]TQN31044.1 glycolate oxidase FAD binding subunit [Haloactinospora alba]
METRPRTERITAELEADGVRVRPAGATDTAGTAAASHVCTPPDAEAAASLLATAQRHDLSVVARGNASKIDWGYPPRRCDLIVDTTALTGISHASGDLIVQAGAGTPVAELQEELARAGQRLTVDTAIPDSTVGGLVAAGVSGPRRMLHGPVRDLIIGMTTVRSDGVLTSSGGTVVKNVAGYDLGKLHTGALGTLGLLTSVTFRLHPLPPASRLITAERVAPAHLRSLLADIRACQAVPAAVELDWPAGAPPGLHVLVEGSSGGIDSRAADIAGLMDGSTVTDELPEWWGRLPGSPKDTVLKTTVPLSEAPAAAAALRDAGRDAGLDVGVRGSAGAGVLYAALPGTADPATAASVLSRARDSLPDGALTVLRASPELLEHGVDLWGDVSGLELMRAVKDRLDPCHTLAPGRFAGGI